MSDSTEEIAKETKAPIDPTLRARVKEQIITARIGLLLRHPWFGNMATRLRITEADDWLGTAATNGDELFYSVEFFSKLSLKEIEFVIAHEILHCAYDHMHRVGDRDRRIYNVACDYLVNNTLIRDRIGEKPKNIDIYHSVDYEGWTSEDVYDDLMKNATKVDIGELLDDHIDWTKDDGSGRPVFSKHEIDQIRENVKESMIGAAQSTSAGNIPAEIKRMISELTEPKLNWKEIIEQQVQSSVRSDYTFVRPSRKGWHTNAILPGTEREQTIEIAIALDMSGSIADSQARDFISEVKGIMDQYADYTIDLWTFDTKVYNHQRFTSDDCEDITKYDIQGGGGTSFECNWAFMEEIDLVPTKLLVFSDMYAWDSFGDPTYCDTVFINHGRPGFEAPFGITVPYTE